MLKQGVREACWGRQGGSRAACWSEISQVERERETGEAEKLHGSEGADWRRIELRGAYLVVLMVPATETVRSRQRKR